MKKKILLLGATGSIGRQALEVIKLFPKLFSVVGLSAKNNAALLAQQAQEFSVSKTYLDEKSLIKAVLETDFDILVNALCGEVGVAPTIAACKRGKIIALANKEALVSAGEQIIKLAHKHKAEIRPIDSEHSAIWQALRAGAQKEVQKIILTCSGGPFRDGAIWPLAKLKKATPAQALTHPVWQMGQKISVDSATLMNKALELIEAVRLFDIPPEKIEVVIHPQSVVHSAVEFCDGSVVAQMGMPDMRTAIALALSAPARLPLPFPRFSFFDQKLTFEKVDAKRFPSIEFARRALAKGEKACAALNRANEEAVADFLAEKITLGEIFERVKKTL